MQAVCENRGMPMREENRKKGTSYCKYCTAEGGKPKSHKEALEGFTMPLMKMKREEAEKLLEKSWRRCLHGLIIK